MPDAKTEAERQAELLRRLRETNRQSSQNAARPPYPAPSPTGGGKP